MASYQENSRNALWCGKVSQKNVRMNDWQPIWVILQRSSILCYQTKDDGKPVMTINIHTFEMSLPENETESNLLILSNGASKIIFGFAIVSDRDQFVEKLQSIGVKPSQTAFVENFLESSKIRSKCVSFSDNPVVIPSQFDEFVNKTDLDLSGKLSPEEKELISSLERANLNLIADVKAVSGQDLRPDSPDQLPPIFVPAAQSSFPAIRRNQLDKHKRSSSDLSDSPDKGQKKSKALLKLKFLFGNETNKSLNSESKDTSSKTTNPSQSGPNALEKLKSLFQKADEPVYHFSVDLKNEKESESLNSSFEHPHYSSETEENLDKQGGGFESVSLFASAHSDVAQLDIGWANFDPDPASSSEDKANDDLVDEPRVEYCVESQSVQFLTEQKNPNTLDKTSNKEINNIKVAEESGDEQEISPSPTSNSLNSSKCIQPDTPCHSEQPECKDSFNETSIVGNNVNEGNHFSKEDKWKPGQIEKTFKIPKLDQNTSNLLDGESKHHESKAFEYPKLGVTRRSDESLSDPVGDFHDEWPRRKSISLNEINIADKSVHEASTSLFDQLNVNECEKLKKKSLKKKLIGKIKAGQSNLRSSFRSLRKSQAASDTNLDKIQENWKNSSLERDFCVPEDHFQAQQSVVDPIQEASQQSESSKEPNCKGEVKKRFQRQTSWAESHETEVVDITHDNLDPIILEREEDTEIEEDQEAKNLEKSLDFENFDLLVNGEPIIDPDPFLDQNPFQKDPFQDLDINDRYPCADEISPGSSSRRKVSDAGSVEIKLKVAPNDIVIETFEITSVQTKVETGQTLTKVGGTSDPSQGPLHVPCKQLLPFSGKKSSKKTLKRHSKTRQVLNFLHKSRKVGRYENDNSFNSARTNVKSRSLPPHERKGTLSSFLKKWKASREVRQRQISFPRFQNTEIDEKNNKVNSDLSILSHIKEIQALAEENREAVKSNSDIDASDKSNFSEETDHYYSFNEDEENLTTPRNSFEQHLKVADIKPQSRFICKELTLSSNEILIVPSRRSRSCDDIDILSTTSANGEEGSDTTYYSVNSVSDFQGYFRTKRGVDIVDTVSLDEGMSSYKEGGLYSSPKLARTLSGNSLGMQKAGGKLGKSAKSPFKRIRQFFKSQPGTEEAKFDIQEDPMHPSRLNHNPLFMDDEMQDHSVPEFCSDFDSDPTMRDKQGRSGIIPKRDSFTSFQSAEPVSNVRKVKRVKPRIRPRLSRLETSSSSSSSSSPCQTSPELSIKGKEEPYVEKGFEEEVGRIDFEAESVTDDEDPEDACDLDTSVQSGFVSELNPISVDDFSDDRDQQQLSLDSLTSLNDPQAMKYEQTEEDIENDIKNLEQIMNSSTSSSSSMVFVESAGIFKPRSLDKQSLDSHSPESQRNLVNIESGGRRKISRLSENESSSSSESDHKEKLKPLEPILITDEPVESFTNITNLSVSPKTSPKKKERKSVQRSDSERSSTKRKGKRITPPDSRPVLRGLLEVTLNPESRWRRRMLTIQEGMLLIFPRPESKYATARVKLPHHGLHSAKEETGCDLAFKITRKSKVTLFMKADTLTDFDTWTQTLTSEIKRLSSSSNSNNSKHIDLSQEDLNLSIGPEDKNEFSAEPAAKVKLDSVPVPAPRSSSLKESSVDPKPKIGESLDSMKVTNGDDGEAPPFDSLEAANLARDKLEETNDSLEEEPKIFINQSGEWEVNNEEASAPGTLSDGKERKFLKDLKEEKIIQESFGSSTSSDGDDRNENDDEDDIPEDWKEAPNEIPVRRCVQVVEDTSSEDNQSQGLMSVIEEVAEEDEPSKTASSDEGDKTNYARGNKIVAEKNLDSLNDFQEERISPDTVTSNDSGMVDPHDEIFSPPHNKEEADVSVKDIAKVWEKDKDKEALSKKWLSMPELPDAKKHKQSGEEVPKVERKQSTEEEKIISSKHAVPKQSSPRPRNVVKCYDAVDDRDVCTLVPIKERRKLFESLAAQAQMEKKKQWFSMPSLDQPKKNKDNYARYTSGYGKQPSQDVHHYNPIEPINLYGLDNEDAKSDRKQRAASTPATLSPSKPIPLVSSLSKESEDFELIPLRDRMRAFESANPVSKPIVSVPKTVSPFLGTLDPTNANTQPPLSSSPPLDIDETESIASSHTSSSTVISASKINSYNVNRFPQSTPEQKEVIPTYSWNDESNGEIYNDKQPVKKSDDDDDALLYVVENGKEFPLTPVSKRKSFFMSMESLEKQPNHASPKSSEPRLMPRDIIKSEPMILDKKQLELERHQEKTQYEHEDCSESGSSSEESEVAEDMVEDEFEKLMHVNEVATAEQQKDTIKSAQVPYIEEEQEVLASINLVKAMKEKFLINGN